MISVDEWIFFLKQVYKREVKAYDNVDSENDFISSEPNTTCCEVVKKCMVHGCNVMTDETPLKCLNSIFNISVFQHQTYIYHSSEYTEYTC